MKVRSEESKEKDGGSTSLKPSDLDTCAIYFGFVLLLVTGVQTELH